MKAIAIDAFGTIDDLHIAAFKDLPIDNHEVKVRIDYAGVNPVDWKICEGVLKNRLQHEFPLIPGWDASGTITSIGSAVEGYKVGDQVYAYCRKPVVQYGTYAETINLESIHLAPKPKSLSAAQAAAIPLVSLTAWQALFDRAKIKKSDTILIHAGAGGVGSVAIQLARYAGAKVITTASTKNHPYVKDLGADYVIDYKLHPFVEKVKQIYPNGVDIVFDCAGYETQVKSFECLRKGGTLVSIVTKPDPALVTKYEVKSEFVFVEANGQQLRKIGNLIDAGVLKCPHITEMSIKDAAEALQLQKTDHSSGKIVLKIDFDKQ